MTTENRDLAPLSRDATAQSRKLNVTSLLFGAYAAASVLAIYSVIQLLGSVLATVLPYAAGGVLFVTLSAIFASIITMLKKMRKSARKTIAVRDTYAAIAVLTVLGYFAAACVATFQPGAPASDLWSNGAVAAVLWVCIFGGGKYAADLFHDGARS